MKQSMLQKNGKVIPVEMSSKLLEYEDNLFIVSVGRNITNRIDFEKKLLSTIIATEEKERKRFSADLHDELVPVLSTIKPELSNRRFIKSNYCFYEGNPSRKLSG